MTTDRATILRAYHNDPALRDATLAQMRGHASADQIRQGHYWKRQGTTYRGCAVGCLTHDAEGGHHLYPTRWGIPQMLARLEDRIFEALAPEEARAWPVAFLSAIPLGADLSLVWPRFGLALLSDPEHGSVRHTREGSLQRAAVAHVAALFQRTVDGEIVPIGIWTEARRAAAAAANAAAYAANAAAAAAHAAADTAASADDAAADAADAAAYAAAYAAADAADAAAYAAAAADAAADAYAAHWLWCRDLLLRLLASAPVPT
jgi:hypothetical protein